MIENSVYQFVVSSSVRVDLLERLSSGPKSTNTLIDDLDASKSAVYTALADLERRHVCFEDTDGWQLTGQGRLVFDQIEQWESLYTLLEQDRDYWATHRTDHIPRQFRQRLPELSEYDVVRSEPPNVRAHARKVVSLLETIDHCHTAIPIHVPEYSEAFPDSPDSRLIFPPRVIDQLYQETQAGDREQLCDHDHVDYRVGDIEFGLTAVDEFMMLALRPHTDTMVESVLVSTDDSAIQWASELYASLWSDAEPLGSYLETEHGYHP